MHTRSSLQVRNHLRKNKTKKDHLTRRAYEECVRESNAREGDEELKRERGSGRDLSGRRNFRAGRGVDLDADELWVLAREPFEHANVRGISRRNVVDDAVARDDFDIFIARTCRHQRARPAEPPTPVQLRSARDVVVRVADNSSALRWDLGLITSDARRNCRHMGSQLHGRSDSSRLEVGSTYSVDMLDKACSCQCREENKLLRPPHDGMLCVCRRRSWRSGEGKRV